MAFDIASVAVASALIYGLLQAEMRYRRWKAVKAHERYRAEAEPVFHPKVVKHLHTVVGSASPITCVDCGHLSHSYHSFSDGSLQCLDCAKHCKRIHG